MTEITIAVAHGDVSAVIAARGIRLEAGELFGPAAEAPYSGPLDAVLATTVGYHSAEGLALVTAA